MKLSTRRSSRVLRKVYREGDSGLRVFAYWNKVLSVRRGVGMIPGHGKAARWCLLWCSNEADCVYKMTAKYAGSEVLRREAGPW